MCSFRTIKYKHMCSIWMMTVCAHQYSCFQCIAGICTARKPTNATGIRIRCQQLPALGYQTLQAEIRTCAYPTCSYIRITMIWQLLFCYCCGKTQGQKIRDLSLVKGNRGKKNKKKTTTTKKPHPLPRLFFRILWSVHVDKRISKHWLPWAKWASASLI